MFKCCQSHCQHERDYHNPFQRHHINTLSTRDMHQMHYYHIITLSTRWEERGEGGQIIHGPSEKYFSFYFYFCFHLLLLKLLSGIIHGPSEKYFSSFIKWFFEHADVISCDCTTISAIIYGHGGRHWWKI